jgi:hypothetical protein
LVGFEDFDIEGLEVGGRFGGGRCFVFFFLDALTICVKFILKVVENESYTTYKELSVEG